MRARNGGDILVEALSAQGVNCVWGIPGTHNLPIYGALAGSAIRHILPRHEQGAGFAADGYARSTGRPGVFITTSGPGALNALTAVAQAYSDSVPVLHISAGMPTSHPGRGNGFLHETKQVQPPVDSVAGYSHRVTSVEEIATAVATAFVHFSQRRPRPIHLEIPFDLLDAEGDCPAIAPIAGSVLHPDPDAVRRAGEILTNSRRPMILAGGGAAGCGDELARLAKVLDAPVITSINGKGTLPESSPYAMGAGLDRLPMKELVLDSDVVLVVGSELAPSDLWLEPLPLEGKVVRIDVDPGQLLTNVQPVVSIVSDAAVALGALLTERQIAERVTASGAPGPNPRVEKWRERFADDAGQRSEPWAGILAAIDECLDGRGVIAGDSAMVCYLGATASVRRDIPRSYLYPTGLGTLGYAIPAAVGAAVARPDERVVALVGDGGVMFTLAELAMAAECRLPIPVVIVDNGGYGEIRKEMLDRGDAPLAVDMEAVDFSLIAQGLGCLAHRIDDNDALPDALDQAFVADRPTVLHLRGQ